MTKTCIMCKCPLINRTLNTKYCADCKKEVKREWSRIDYKKNRSTYDEWYKNNKDKVRIGRTKIEQRRRNNLSDRYIKRLLREKSGFTTDQIKDNPELIETKRIIIKTKRLCKTSQS